MIKRQMTSVLAHQTVKHYEPTQIEHFKTKTQGRYVQLKTVNYLTYTDNLNHELTVKWWNNQAGVLEINSPRAKMRFNKKQATVTEYKVEGMTFLLEIRTRQLEWEEVGLTNEDKELKVQLNYDLYMNEEIIGSYDFRLQFTHEISKIKDK